jgi:hypothetical protein
MAMVVMACYTGPDVDHYVGLVDTFDVPADWELVATQRRGPGEDFSCDPLLTSSCPGADRWYALDGDVMGALQAARHVVEAADFTVDEVLYPACDGPPSAPACTLFASRDADRVGFSIYQPGHVVGLDNPPESDVVIRITAQRGA